MSEEHSRHRTIARNPQLRFLIGDRSFSEEFSDQKDSRLAALSKVANTAQFVSYSVELEQRHAVIRGYKPDHRFSNAREALTILFQTSSEGRVNVRSYSTKASKGSTFLYALETVDEVLGALHQLKEKGLNTIVNETIDVHDGGVSGVVHGEIMEFAPGATPRCVEEPGVTAIDRDLGRQLLKTVYGFDPELEYPPQSRVEFSVHPLRRGYRNSHTLLWEIEDLPNPGIDERFPRWPNRFSRLIGDKAFGLLVADLAGLAVPNTLVVSRGAAPFRFGRDTGTGEIWLRTCPTEQVPGKYSTRRGWADPYLLLNTEDPDRTQLASIICQAAVDAHYSGALRTLDSGQPLVEGVAGTGERFMQGEVPPEELPREVLAAVQSAFANAQSAMGPVRMEWVFDGEQVWVVQLHRQHHPESSRMIYPGEADVFHRFDVGKGLEELRALVESLAGGRGGIVLVGNVGRTSHMCDLLRQARIPSTHESVSVP